LDNILKPTGLNEYLTGYEKSSDGWGAHARSLPGLGVVGRTLEETKQSIPEAIDFYLEGMRHGDRIPDPNSQMECIVVA